MSWGIKTIAKNKAAAKASLAKTASQYSGEDVKKACDIIGNAIDMLPESGYLIESNGHVSTTGGNVYIKIESVSIDE